MGTGNVTNSRRRLTIKAMLVSLAVILGVVTLVASVAGMGRLPEVFGFIGVVLLLEAGFYATL